MIHEVLIVRVRFKAKRSEGWRICLFRGSRKSLGKGCERLMAGFLPGMQKALVSSPAGRGVLRPGSPFSTVENAFRRAFAIRAW